MNNKNIYLISGLGADERVFKHLKLEADSITFINWLEINKQNSNISIQEYASKLLEKIIHPNPLIIGVSFGGIIALEIAKQIPTSQIIIISSIKSENELPFFYKIFKFIPIYKILPYSIFTKFKKLAYVLFGVSNSENKILLEDIINKTDPSFFRWALDNILNWNNTLQEQNQIYKVNKGIKFTHIHGTKDKIFPIKYTKDVIKIEGGGHLMLLTHYKEISHILNTVVH